MKNCAEMCRYAGAEQLDGSKMCRYPTKDGEVPPSGIKYVSQTTGPLPVIAQQMCGVDGNASLCVLDNGTHPPTVRAI